MNSIHALRLFYSVQIRLTVYKCAYVECLFPAGPPDRLAPMECSPNLLLPIPLLTVSPWMKSERHPTGGEKQINNQENEWSQRRLQKRCRHSYMAF